MQVISYISTTWHDIQQRGDLLRTTPGHVAVILWPTAMPILPACWQILNTEEQHRAERFFQDDHRGRFVAAHCGVRRLLAQLIRCDALELNFLANTNGKPELAGNSIYFNLTHSGDWAALAVSRDTQVGIDLEMIRPVEKNLPQNYFSCQEQIAMSMLANEDWLSGFFRCWTRKEALLKAVGVGLSLPLKDFTVTVESDAPAILLNSSLPQLQPQDWVMLHLRCIPGYIGALAGSSSLQNASVFIIDSEHGKDDRFA